MKRNKLFLAALFVTLSAVSSVSALTEAETKIVQKTVTEVRVPEMAATAARLVAQAPKEEKEAVALAAVKAILTDHPTSATALVAAIAKAAPETAPAVCQLAAALVPEDVLRIAKAGATAAPASADKIASALAKQAPKQAVRIAAEVMNAAPIAADKVVVAVSEVLPTTKAELTTVRSRVRAVAGDDAPGAGTSITRPGTISGQTPGILPTQATSSKGFDNRRYATP